MSLATATLTGAIPVAMVLPAAIIMQDLPFGEQVTVLGVLLFVLGGVTALLRSQGRALVQAVRDNTKAQLANTARLAEVVRDLDQLIKSSDEWNNTLLGSIKRVEEALKR